jgi:hypothetical protein
LCFVELIEETDFRGGVVFANRFDELTFVHDRLTVKG